jgi:hypothetical protein
MKYPRLFKKTSTGAIQFWDIEVLSQIGQMNNEEYAPTWGLIVTTYGQLGTDSPQVANEIISKGKSLGKKNATTALEQACAEAKAKWTKHKKEGYVESREAAEAGEVDTLIEGGVDPMLAHHYMDVITDDITGVVTIEKSKDAKNIEFPCKGQPKLDGIRCIAVRKDGKFTLWSRTRKPIKSCTHIQEELERLFFSCGDMVLDGELYNHAYKSDFEKIVSAVRKDEPTEECVKIVQYHIYDVANTNLTFEERNDNLICILSNRPSLVVKLVDTSHLSNEEAVMDHFIGYCKKGYEGLMLRNSYSMYVGKRSYSLQKAKPFNDDEFKIVGFTEGKGKLAGHLGTFICKTKEGNTFDPPLNADQPTLKKMFENGASYIGKMLTVRFQGYTGKNKVPRFSKGHSVRDYE